MHFGPVPEIGSGITAAEAVHTGVVVGALAVGFWLAYKGVVMTVSGTNSFSSNN